MARRQPLPVHANRQHLGQGGWRKKTIIRAYMRIVDVGSDEVGRGSWAGPLVFCALLLAEGVTIPLSVPIRDSKVLSRPQRERSAAFLRKNSTFCFSFVSWETIDKIGIQRAAIRGLKVIAKRIKRLIMVRDCCTGEQYQERYCLKIDGIGV